MKTCTELGMFCKPAIDSIDYTNWKSDPQIEINAHCAVCKKKVTFSGWLSEIIEKMEASDS